MNKVVLITGASRGIGAAAAEYFAKNGFDVAINYMGNDDAANRVREKCLGYGARAIVEKCDIGDEAQVRVMIDDVVGQFGRIDAVVNNAGIVFDKEFEDRTAEDFEKTFRVNVTGTFLVSKYAGPHLRKAKGNIVIASSTSGTDSFNVTSIDYDCSKAALIPMIKNLAKEFAPDVRVNGTALGWADTDMNNELPVDYLEGERGRILLGRFAEVEEVAKLYYYLATDLSSYVNGQVIQIDGGRK